MFLFGAVILIGAAVVALHDATRGTEMALPVGQAFIGAGWTALLVGLLGLYPRLADRSRWLSRAGLLFTVIGIVGYVVMTALSVAVFTNIVAGELESYAILFLPLVAVGSFLAFPLIAIAILRSGVYSRTVGVLLFGPTAIFLANVLTGGNSPWSLVAVIVAQIVVYGTIGYLLRTDGVSEQRAPSPTDTSV